jgi:hypothetical protein
MSGGRAKMGASKAATSVDDEDVYTRADIQKEVQSVLAANHGMLTADQVEIFQSLSFATAKQLVEVILNLLREASAVPLQPTPSPSRASVITQCDETFKKIASPCDPEFFIPFKDTFKDSSIPEFWQHFRGHLLAATNGHIGCASCSVEAVLSANGTSLASPTRRIRRPDAISIRPLSMLLWLKVEHCLSPSHIASFRHIFNVRSMLPSLRI